MRTFLPLSELQLNEANPRLLKEERFTQLVQSLLDFPEMMDLRPAVVDETGIVLGGNMRTRAKAHLLALPDAEKLERIKGAVSARRAARGASYRDHEEDHRKLLAFLLYNENVPVTQAEGLSDAQKREFIIKDNASFGEWDWDALANGDWPDAPILNNWGLDIPKDWDSTPTVLDDISLPSGEAPAFKTMSFVLTADQALTVETALGIVITENDITVFDGTGNDNKNGNALTYLAEQFNSEHNFTDDDAGSDLD